MMSKPEKVMRRFITKERMKELGLSEDRPLPIPGDWIAVQSSNPKYPEEWDVLEGGRGGYSVIGDGFITEGQAKEIALRHNLTIGQRDRQPDDICCH